MRLLLLSFFLTASCVTFSQHDQMLWTSIGVEGKVIKKLTLGAEFRTRFDRYGLQTFFPQVGLTYKVKKWFKPSVEYRFIVDKNKIGNYKSSHRLNLNANFKKGIERFFVGGRLRYQYAFSRISAAQEYDADFDQAIRVKPFISYDINNSIFTPKVSAEFFYNPEFGPKGRRFTKIRFAVGSSLELDGPHQVSFKYQLDKRLYDFSADLRHVLALSYTYKL